MNIYQSIAKIMEEAGAISKSRKNTQQNYSFRGIDEIYNEFNPHLAKYGVFFCPKVLSKEREERSTKTGGNLIYTILTVEFNVYASDGTSVTLVTVGEAMDSGDKSANKAMSGALKYAMMQLFCIPTEDEKDTETQSHSVTPKTGEATSKIPQTVAPPDGRTCVICEKKFIPDVKWPKSETCSGVCGNKRKAIKTQPSAPQESTKAIYGPSEPYGGEFEQPVIDDYMYGEDGKHRGSYSIE